MGKSTWALKRIEIGDLKGRTLVKVSRHQDGHPDLQDRQDTFCFEFAEGPRVFMLHEQACCEVVTLEDIIGDFNDLIGKPIKEANESSNCLNADSQAESETWTFYRIGAGYNNVVLRWYGTSNGYYSESVNLYEDVADE